jgi:hypothetical protein
MDLLTVYLFVNYEGKPAHFFGKVGAGFSLAGFVILLYLAILWILGSGPIGNRPLLFLGMLLMIIGFELAAMGLLAALQVHAGQKNEPPYILGSLVERRPTEDVDMSPANRASQDPQGCEGPTRPSGKPDLE